MDSLFVIEQSSREVPALSLRCGQSSGGKNEEWRQPLPTERAQMMGFSAQCFNGVPGPAAVRRQRQNCMIGNGFHLPMVVALLCLLPRVLEANIPCPLADVDETLLKDRVLGTIWEPGRLQAFLGLLSSNQVVDRMRRTIFHSLPIPVSIWAA